MPFGFAGVLPELNPLFDNEGTPFGFYDEFERTVQHLPVLLVLDQGFEEGRKTGNLKQAFQGQGLLLDAGYGGNPGRTRAQGPSVEPASEPNFPTGQQLSR